MMTPKWDVLFSVSRMFFVMSLAMLAGLFFPPTAKKFEKSNGF